MDKKLVKELTENQMAIAELEHSMSTAVAKFRKDLDVQREKETELKEAIKASMEANGVTKFENDILKITYVAGSVRNNIDAARLKEELPEVAAKYIKQTSVKSSVRITVKELK